MTRLSNKKGAVYSKITTIRETDAFGDPAG